MQREMEMRWRALAPRDSQRADKGTQGHIGRGRRPLTWALTSTCPVLSSRLTISKSPILAAWWRQVEPSSS